MCGASTKRSVESQSATAQSNIWVFALRRGLRREQSLRPQVRWIHGRPKTEDRRPRRSTVAAAVRRQTAAQGKHSAVLA